MNKVKLIALFIVFGMFLVGANELAKVNMPHGKDYSYQFTIPKEWVSHDYYVYLGKTKYDDNGAYKSTWLIDGDNDETYFFNISINPNNCKVGKGKSLWKYFNHGYQTIEHTFTIDGKTAKDRIADYICKVATGEIKEAKLWWPL